MFTVATTSPVFVSKPRIVLSDTRRFATQIVPLTLVSRSGESAPDADAASSDTEDAGETGEKRGDRTTLRMHCSSL